MSTARSDVAAAFRRCVALGGFPDAQVAIDAWSTFADLAEQELAAPTEFTDVAGLARMYASARLTEADHRELAGDLSSAESAHAAAVAVMERHGDDAAQIDVRRQKANTLKAQARFGEAMAELHAVVADTRLRGDAVAQARATLDLAMLLEWLGDYDRADDALARASAAIEHELTDIAPATDFATTLLSVFAGTGDPERTTALQSLRMELGSTRGMVAKRSGRHDDAIEHFRSVLADYEQWGTGPAIRFHLAHLELLGGRPANAVTMARELRPQFEAHPGLATKLPALGWIEAEATLPADPAAALVLADGVHTDLRRRGDLELAWKARRTTARALAALDRPDEACHAYLDAAQTVDGLRRIPIGYRLETTYFDDRRPMFDEAIALAARTARAGDCWRLIDLAKSRSLATLLYGERRPRVTSEHTERFEALSREIDALDYGVFAGGDGRADERERLVRERAELIELLRAGDPRWRSLSQPPPLDGATIRSSLGTAAGLTLHLAGSVVTAVLLTTDDELATQHTVDRDTAAALGDHRRVVQGSTNPPAYDFGGWHGLGLADLLGDEMAERLGASERVAIAPHGALHLIPWATMTVGGRRWYETTATAIVPNLAVLPALARPPRSPSPTALVVDAPAYGDSGLRAVGGESDEIVGHYAPRVTAIRGADASEAALHAALTAEVDVFHVSCHGVIDDVDPSASALLAADGRVDAAEIAMTQLGATDIVLAACSTGYRPHRVGDLELVGDDIVGMPGALLEAGASTVLVSIPLASDATSVAFMGRFHRHRAAGTHPADALRAAQHEMSADHDVWSWCGFSLYGHPGGH